MSLPVWKYVYFPINDALNASKGEIKDSFVKVMADGVKVMQTRVNGDKGVYDNRCSNSGSQAVLTLQLLHFINYIGYNPIGTCCSVAEACRTEATAIAVGSLQETNNAIAVDPNAATKAKVITALEQMRPYVFMDVKTVLLKSTSIIMPMIGQIATCPLCVSDTRGIEDGEIEAQLINTFIGVVRALYNRFLGSGDIKLKCVTHNLIKDYNDDVIEDLFIDYLSAQASQSSLLDLFKIFTLDLDDVFEYSKPNMSVPQMKGSYMQMVAEWGAGCTTQFTKVARVQSILTKFKKDRNVYRRYYMCRTRLYDDVVFDPVVAVGKKFSFDDLNTSHSVVKDFLDRFNTVYGFMLSDWKGFVNYFYHVDDSYIYPNSAVRMSLIDGRPTIYHLTVADPYTPSGYIMKITDEVDNMTGENRQVVKPYLDVAKSSILQTERDKRPVSTWYDPNKLTVSNGVRDNDLLQLFVDCYSTMTIERTADEGDVFRGRLLQKALRIVPPSTEERTAYFIADNMIGTEYHTEVVDLTKLTASEFFFIIRYSEGNGDLKAKYESDLEKMIHGAIIGPDTNLMALPEGRIKTVDYLTYLSQFGMQVKELAVKEYGINTDYPLSARCEMYVSLNKKQYIYVPVSKTNINRSVLEPLKSKKAGFIINPKKGPFAGKTFYGDKEGFCISECNYSDVYKGCCVCRIAVDLTKDVNIGNFMVVGQDENTITFKLCLKFGGMQVSPSDRHESYAMLKEGNPMYGWVGSDDIDNEVCATIVKALIQIYNACQEGYFENSQKPSTVILTSLQAILKYFNLGFMQMDGQVLDSEVLASTKTWYDVKEAINAMINTIVSGSHDKEQSQAYESMIDGLFARDCDASAFTGIGIMTFNANDLFNLLVDQTFGFVRPSHFETSISGVRVGSMSTLLLDTSVIARIAANKLCNRLMMAFSENVIQAV